MCVCVCVYVSGGGVTEKTLIDGIATSLAYNIISQISRQLRTYTYQYALRWICLFQS